MQFILALVLKDDGANQGSRTGRRKDALVWAKPVHMGIHGPLTDAERTVCGWRQDTCGSSQT